MRVVRFRSHGDLAKEVVAKRIIELAKEGERDPELLCDAL